MKYIRLLLIMLVLFGLAAFAYMFPRKVIVGEIVCSSQYELCNEEIDSALQEYEGKNLREAKASVNKYLKENPLIKNYSINYQLLDKLEIDTIEDKAYYAITNEKKEVFAHITSSGIVVALQESTNLPFLYVHDEIPNIGKKVDVQTKYALELLEDLAYSYTVTTAELKESHLSVVINNAELIFPLTGDKEILLGSANLILSRLKATRQETRINTDKESVLSSVCSSRCEIDLRYDNPVVRESK